MAYGRLASAYDMAGEVELKSESIRRAYSLRDKMSERERLYLETQYYHSLTGELEKAEQVYEMWQQVYPRDPSPHDNLQNIYVYQGKHEEALAEGRETLRLRPYSVSSYEDVFQSALCLNRLDEAQATLQQADQRKMQSELLLWLRYLLAF